LIVEVDQITCFSVTEELLDRYYFPWLYELKISY